MRAVIVSAAPDIAELAEQTVRGLGSGYTAVIQGGAEARRLILGETPPDIVIVNTPLADEFGQELAESAAEETGAVTLLLCLGDIADDLADRLSESGVIVLSKPVNRDQLGEAIRLAMDGNPFSEEKESTEVLRRIADIRLINRAKSVLMKNLHFTEPQAHRHLEKQAMNNRCTRRQAAEQIIKTYSIDG